MATFGTFVSGQVLTAAELNAAGAWSSYTPTWTQSATITKTVNWARYTQFNKLVVVNIKMTASSAGTANNKILVGLPVNASSNNLIMGSYWFIDDSLTTKYAWAPGFVIYDSATAVAFSLKNSSLEDARSRNDVRYGQDYLDQNGNTANTVTIASGDSIYLQLTYEAA